MCSSDLYAKRGVRVKGINPGQTLTGRLQGRMQALAQQQGITPDEALRKATSELPMGRFADPEEIANLALYLCSPLSSYVTGTVIAMDGALYPVL